MDTDSHTKSSQNSSTSDPSSEFDAPPSGASEAGGHWVEKKLRLSINERIVDKNVNGASLAEGFVNQQITVLDLLAHIAQGRAYCAEMNGTRRTTNFVASDLLSVDIDGSMTLDEAVEHEFVSRHASFIYTTASHTDDEPRFRIGFALERTITSAEEMRAALRSIALRLSGDGAATDPCRIFYGNRKAIYVPMDNGISAGLLDELILQSKNANQPDSHHRIDASTVSSIRLPQHQMVNSVEHGRRLLTSLERSTAIYCPFHNDKHASAYVMINKVGQKGIRCSACKQSWWPGDASHLYDFNSFETAVRAAAAVPAKPSPIDTYMIDVPGSTPTHVSAASITFPNDEFLKPFPLNLGATFIRSRKGSGKTEFLKHLTTIETGRVLLIGHRRSLIRSMCTRLELDCYLDDDQNRSSQRRYGVCLDSLLKISLDKPYDYVFIDESEQVFAHVLSSTIGEKRSKLLHRLERIIKNAKRVVALDADLSWNTFLRICEWRPPPSETNKNSIVINTFVKAKGMMHMVASKNQIIGEIKTAAAAGRRCFVTSNSKKVITNLAAVLRNDQPEIRLIAITSDTAASSDEAIRSFLSDPKSESTKYQMVLGSPSLGTGVDLTFERQEDHFDIVFGIFDALILSHFDCDQQLARVRSPGEVRVFVSPATFAFETELDCTVEDAMAWDMMGHLMVGYNAMHRAVFRELAYEDPLLKIAAQVLSVVRASKNNLKQHFRQYVSEQGWQLVDVRPDSQLKAVGTASWATGKQLSKAETERTLMDAAPISEDEFDTIWGKYDDGEPIDDASRASLTRALIERFYRTGITPDLIAQDNDGTLRQQVLTFEYLSRTKYVDVAREAAAASLSGEVNLAEFIESKPQRDLLLFDILEKTDYYDGGTFFDSLVCSSPDFVKFIEYIRTHEAAIVTQFDKPIYKDLEEKPVRQLNRFLKLAGLKVSTYKKPFPNRDTNRNYYILDRDSLGFMQGIADRRRTVDARTFIAQNERSSPAESVSSAEHATRKPSIFPNELSP